MQNENTDELFESLKASKFKQQKLPAWRPVPTITSTTITFVSFGVVFIVIGAVVLHYSNQVIEVSQAYQTCTDFNKACNVTFQLDSKMAQPVMVYYQLNNFYQNHRRYVKSKSNSQLNGQLMTRKEMEDSGDCSPVVTNEQMGKYFSVNGTPLNASDVANPCGLIAKSFFNDTYQLFFNDKEILINQSNIAWDADKELKFKIPEDPSGKGKDYWKTLQWIDVTDEHFIVWMRPAGLPNFRKLWGRINTDLEVGKYTVQIQNNYDVRIFNGEKFFVVSTVNSFGGKNNFLGISYLVVGSLCIVLAIVFLIGYKIHNSNQRKEN